MGRAKKDQKAEVHVTLGPGLQPGSYPPPQRPTAPHSAPGTPRPPFECDEAPSRVGEARCGLALYLAVKAVTGQS